MKRSGVSTTIVFFALAPVLVILGLAGIMQPARASVFCGADVVGIVPWDVANDRELDGLPTRLYGFDIGADQGIPMFGKMVVVTDTKAYSVPFSDARFVPYPSDPKRFYSSGRMFVLPDAAIVRYAWIDDATDPQTGKDATCVTIPFEVQPNPRKGAVTTSGVPGKAYTLDRYQATTATYVQNLPAMPCGAMYTKPEIIDMPKETDYWDTSQGRQAKPVFDRIDLGSDGRVINVEIVKSSGSIPVDVASQDTAAKGHYKPATFLCSPAASTLEFVFEYSVQ
jgi:hypothetical protein